MTEPDLNQSFSKVIFLKTYMQHSPKIVMPLTNESDAPLPSPHFNEEATVLSARPVVPLASSGNYAAALRSATNAPLVKRFLPLALIVAAAVGIGIAGGLVISRRHANQTEAKSVTAAASEATSSTANETSNQQVQYTATTAREKSAKPETQTTINSVQPSDAPAVKTTTPAAIASTATRGKKKRVSVEPAPQQQISLPPAQARNRRAQEASVSDEDEARARDDEARAERRAARAERRRAQNGQPDAALPPLPRQVERATQQLNRIQDIFEGQKP